MQVIALCQTYNEGEFLDYGFQWICPLVDKIVISEGRLTPFGGLTQHSTDNTRDIIEKWMQKNNKITFVNAFDGGGQTREKCEGNNKNNLLSLANPEPGDIIFVWDVDEFWHPDKFIRIIDLFKKNNNIKHIPVEEYQFAYNLKLYFEASHGGRFVRFVDGAHFGTTNHFIYPDGKDITKDYEYLQHREYTEMIHLCWCKHPKNIRDKVISFNRPSFTSWFNYVYLVWPSNPEIAYRNNSNISPYFGTGFAEGQHKKLELFDKKIPLILSKMELDWISYINENKSKLRI